LLAIRPAMLEPYRIAEAARGRYLSLRRRRPAGFSGK
jgi:hypothetical protein